MFAALGVNKNAPRVPIWHILPYVTPLLTHKLPRVHLCCYFVRNQLLLSMMGSTFHVGQRRITGTMLSILSHGMAHVMVSVYILYNIRYN